MRTDFPIFNADKTGETAAGRTILGLISREGAPNLNLWGSDGSGGAGWPVVSDRFGEVFRGFAFCEASKWPQNRTSPREQRNLWVACGAAGGPGGSVLDTGGLAGVV